jgi:hypothetical protein
LTADHERLQSIANGMSEEEAYMQYAKDIYALRAEHFDKYSKDKQ